MVCDEMDEAEDDFLIRTGLVGTGRESVQFCIVTRVPLQVNTFFFVMGEYSLFFIKQGELHDVATRKPS
jgi:hypothetical protein